MTDTYPYDLKAFSMNSRVWLKTSENVIDNIYIDTIPEALMQLRMFQNSIPSGKLLTKLFTIGFGDYDGI